MEQNLSTSIWVTNKALVRQKKTKAPRALNCLCQTAKQKRPINSFVQTFLSEAWKSETQDSQYCFISNYAWVMSPYLCLIINILTVLCYFLYPNFKTLKSQKQEEKKGSSLNTKILFFFSFQSLHFLASSLAQY